MSDQTLFTDDGPSDLELDGLEARLTAAKSGRPGLLRHSSRCRLGRCGAAGSYLLLHVSAANVSHTVKVEVTDQ